MRFQLKYRYRPDLDSGLHLLRRCLLLILLQRILDIFKKSEFIRNSKSKFKEERIVQNSLFACFYSFGDPNGSIKKHPAIFGSKFIFFDVWKIIHFHN